MSYYTVIIPVYERPQVFIILVKIGKILYAPPVSEAAFVIFFEPVAETGPFIAESPSPEDPIIVEINAVFPGMGEYSVKYDAYPSFFSF